MSPVTAFDAFLPSLAFIDGVGGPEMLLILVIVLLLFGGDKLPEFARGMGKTMRELKKAASGVEEEFRRAMEEDERKKAAAAYEAANAANANADATSTTPPPAEGAPADEGAPQAGGPNIDPAAPSAPGPTPAPEDSSEVIFEPVPNDPELYHDVPSLVTAAPEQDAGSGDEDVQRRPDGAEQPGRRRPRRLAQLRIERCRVNRGDRTGRRRDERKQQPADQAEYLRCCGAGSHGHRG